MPSPAVVVLGGPNGAGKSTVAPRLLRGSLKVEEFVMRLASGEYLHE
jgi:ABC-type cobalamin/Fe3+-siderophores transport system ATPase subunit